MSIYQLLHWKKSQVARNQREVNRENFWNKFNTLFDIEIVTQRIIDVGILTKKSYDDCQHIAAAVVGECDCIISWNFKHIVNIKTIRGVRAITNLTGYKGIDILSPTVLLESEG